ncbi:MAG: CHASE2 domain-containing protein [Cyanobacteria bacterium J06621_8]
MRLRAGFLSTIIGCLFVATFSYFDLLPLVECKLYDAFLRSRPDNFDSLDNDIVIIKISEEDIKKYGFPVSDATLADLLDKVRLSNPAVIGLSLHRNTEGETPDRARLNSIFRDTPGLIGIEKTDGGNPNLRSITPNSELEKQDRTAASEIIEDSLTGDVRRGYLYVQKSNQEQSIPSLGLAVALKYLNQQGIVPESSGDEGWLKLNKAIFPLLEPNLIYDELTVDNYQSIINFSDQQSTFSYLTLSQVLSSEFDLNLLRNKIIFIGTMALSIEDTYITPYSSTLSNGKSFSYGVEIYASATYQVVSAALYARTVIRVMPTFGGYVSFILLASTSSFITWFIYLNFQIIKNKFVYLFYCLFTCSLIIAIGYISLLFGWWIYTLTNALIVLTCELTIYYFIRSDDLERQNKLLQIELEETQKNLVNQGKLSLYQKIAKYLAHEIKNKTNIQGLNIQNAETKLGELKESIAYYDYLFESDNPEVRSPVTVIDESLEKMQRLATVNDKISDIINRIYEQGTLVGSESPQSELLTPLEINGILRNALLDSQQLWIAKYGGVNLEVVTEYDQNLLLVDGILSEVETVFNNILNNSLFYLYRKYQNNHGFVPKFSVTTRNLLQSSQVEIIIRDNGVGIAPENLDKVFDMFWTTKSDHGGFGLGLSIAKELVEKFGGNISLNSVHGEFAEFVIILPGK